MDKKTAATIMFMGGGLFLIIGGAVAKKARTPSLSPQPPSPNPNVTRWDDYILRSGVSAPIVAAIIEVESGGYDGAKGTSGEIGLMQVKCDTARQVGYTGECQNLFAPLANILYGSKYMLWQLNRYNGDISRAFSAYNAGTATDANPLYVQKSLSAYHRYLTYYGKDNQYA